MGTSYVGIKIDLLLTRRGTATTRPSVSTVGSVINLAEPPISNSPPPLISPSPPAIFLLARSLRLLELEPIVEEEEEEDEIAAEEAGGIGGQGAGEESEPDSTRPENDGIVAARGWG